MDFPKPVIVYTAATNVEAHLIVSLLQADGVPAHAVEDQSGVSLWMFGTISQFHKPNIWVDESTVQHAADLIRAYEEKKRARNHPGQSSSQIPVICEGCGKTTTFPNSLDGTTQECSHCHAYVDVGALPSDDDVSLLDD